DLTFGCAMPVMCVSLSSAPTDGEKEKEGISRFSRGEPLLCGNGEAASLGYLMSQLSVLILHENL
ncbi:hypothetical protein M9458_043546, partial [Cirrhinus mrigala]